KLGSAIPTAASARTLWSTAVFRRSAASVPSGTPTRTARRMAERPSVRLAGARVAEFEGRPEVAVGKTGEIADVLRGNRLVEPVSGIEVRPDRRRQRLLLVEGPAWCEPDDEKRQRDDDEQRRDQAEKPADREAEHLVHRKKSSRRGAHARRSL